MHSLSQQERDDKVYIIHIGCSSDLAWKLKVANQKNLQSFWWEAPWILHYYEEIKAWLDKQARFIINDLWDSPRLPIKCGCLIWWMGQRQGSGIESRRNNEFVDKCS